MLPLMLTVCFLFEIERQNTNTESHQDVQPTLECLETSLSGESLLSLLVDLLSLGTPLMFLRCFLLAPIGILTFPNFNRYDQGVMSGLISAPQFRKPE